MDRRAGDFSHRLPSRAGPRQWATCGGVPPNPDTEMIVKREIRHFNIEARSAETEENPTKIVGRAAVFNTIAHGEMIRKGAFAKSLEEQDDIKAYLGHNPLNILARRANGTLELSESDQGLEVTIYPNLNSQADRDILAKVERGDINQMSFGFTPVKEEMADIDGEQVRVLKEVRLFEVSVVTEPWYETTVAEAREKADADEQPEPVPADHSTEKAKPRHALRLAKLKLLEME